MDCRVELKFMQLEGTEQVRAESGDRSYDLWTEATWKDVAVVSVEGSRAYCTRLASWAADKYNDLVEEGETCPVEQDDRCVCGEIH